MSTLLRDLRHALKGFRENLGFTIAAVAALTLGIGVNTAIFSVVNAVLLKPIPFDEPDRIVSILNSANGIPAGTIASPAKFMHYRMQSDVLEDVSAFRQIQLNYGDDTPERITGGQVSEAYFRAFRVPIALGRGFIPEEDAPNGPRVVVIGHRFWTERLASDPNVLGRSIRLSGDTYTIVGVVGEDVDMRQFGSPELWTPFQLDPNTRDQGHFFQSAARLRPGVTLEQAQARLEASAAEFRAKFPEALGENGGFTVRSFQEAMVGPSVRTGLYVLFGAVGFVLLIACANVANLLLVRATGRRREIAIRSTLGAGRWRIVRQLLTESVLLSMVGGVLGLVLGFVGMRALLSVSTAGLPRLGTDGSLLGLDWRVVSFTLGLSLATGVLFGLVPALVASRSDLNAVIKDSSSRSGSGFRQNKTRSVLVAVEVGLAVVLLIGAALMIRTSLALSRVDPGFTTENVITMRVSLSGPRFQRTEGVAQTARIALERLRAVPGVAAAVSTCCVPLQGGLGLPFNIVGRANEGPFTGGSGFVITSSGYFETFEIPILRGRGFTDNDGAAAPPVVIVNEAFVKEFWDEGADPLADRLVIGGGLMRELEGEPSRQIVGIVGDVRAAGLSNDPGPMMYVPQGQVPDALNALTVSMGPVAFLVRTSVDADLVSGVLREELRQATGLPVTDVQPMDEVVSLSLAQQRLSMLLMSIFGASALLLAAIGIYGLMAYSVQQRTQEIGIRMALGAEVAHVKRLVIRQGMLLVVVGIAAGLLAAYFLANLLASFLYQIQPRDVAVFVAVPAALTLIALAAVAIPASRASLVDPLDALRYE